MKQRERENEEGQGNGTLRGIQRDEMKAIGIGEGGEREAIQVESGDGPRTRN
jgi:hypothetical protein